MLALTRIFLHNWHRFNHHVIEVQDSLYLAGHNGSGKSSLLDAIQLVLVANLRRIRFNSSAQDVSERGIDSYVRGKLGEDRWLRPGRTVAYVALEFTNTEARSEVASSRKSSVTLGACIEAEQGHPPDRSYFILPDKLDPELFTPGGLPLTRQQLRKTLRDQKKGQSFDQVEEYQTEMLDRLGGLNERFIDLFLRALYFRPITNIDDFVEQWLLERKDISIETLVSVRERLGDLRHEAERTEQRIYRLGEIVAQQLEVLRLDQLHDQYMLLAALLKLEVAQRDAARVDELIAAHTRELSASQEAIDLNTATLRGAEQALAEAQRRLSESDAARRREELLRQIAAASREADAIAARWRALQGDLQREATGLRPLLTLNLLEPSEHAAIRALIENVPATPSDLRRQGGFHLVEDAAAQLDAAHTRAIEQVAVLRSELDALRQRARQLSDEVERLVNQGVLRYDPDAVRMQDRLERVLGERPKLLCEVLEISDPRWQDAVEAMLGARRFNIIVAPGQFDQAAHELDRARAQGQIYGVGLIDLQNVGRDSHWREPRPDALSQYVTSPVEQTSVVAYVNFVLGDIVACETVDDLRQYRRAVTPQVVVYSDYTMRAVRPDRYTPHFIGARARQSQIDARRRELAELKPGIDALEEQLRNMQALERLLNGAGRLTRLAERLNGELDDQPLRAQIDAARADLQALDLTSLHLLEAEISRLGALAEKYREEQRQLYQKRGMLEGKLTGLRENRLACERTRVERAREADSARVQLAAAIEGATTLLTERLDRPNLADEVINAESGARRFETLRSNGANKLTALGTSYNTVEQFGANPGDPTDQRYDHERERLMATDLPAYQTHIAQAEREAEDELREHVLHTLREQITTARRKLDQINDALAHLPAFGNEKYRFTSARADEVQEFFELIMSDAQLLGAGSLFESQFYAAHKDAFDRFYELLTRRPQSRIEAEEQERLTDYRHYLSYDIEVTNTVTEQKSRLSKIMNQTSGGETQTPFYLTIAASFVQLYRIQERSKRPTIRLVAFDEAFSKMDQSRIGATLELFQQFNLQIVTATPLERCEYLAPKICTSLVLTVVRDGVHIEPYRNYVAQLDRLRAAQEERANAGGDAQAPGEVD